MIERISKEFNIENIKHDDKCIEVFGKNRRKHLFKYKK